MRLRSKRTAVLACALPILLTARAALAHHSTAVYDMSKDITVKGTVVKVDWTNPHTWVYVDAADDQGNVTHWELESLSPNILARAGWGKTDVKSGERVTVVAHPQRDGVKRARLERITMADDYESIPARALSHRDRPDRARGGPSLSNQSHEALSR
jgi:hypothetical protein